MKRRFIYRVAAMLASLSILPIGLAAAGTPEGVPPHLQARAAASNEFTAAQEIRPRAGISFTHLKLDLRAPQMAPAAEAQASIPGSDDADMAGSRRAAFQLPAMTPMSSAKEFATKARREGVPFARLWESKSALVSVGLNQKGHLGLWLIQKSH